jgi:dihydroorotase
VFDLATTISKFIALGLPLTEAIRRVTVLPAVALGRPKLGSLAPGSVGDATLFTLEQTPQRYYDCVGEVIESAGGINVTGTVRAGEWYARAPR